MSINEKIKIELFEDFYTWLKDDGLKPRRSERLHRKKIYAALLNNDQMTLENFNDFLESRKIIQIKQLLGQTINLQDQLLTIDEVIIDEGNEEFKMKNINMNINIKCKYSELEDIENLIVKEIK